MKILVTGASGFLGARLCRLLCEEGHGVRASYHPGDDPRLLDGLPLESRRPADLGDEGALGRAVAGVEAVFHVASLVSFRQRDYARLLAVNVDGTRLLLRLALEAGVQRLVYTSTVNTLGIPEPGMVGDEQTPFSWGPWHLGYMDSKAAAERLVLEAAERGHHTLAVLPGTLFGPGDINRNAGAYLLAGARGRLVAAPPGGTSVAHVDDVARGHLLALQRGRPGERYVLGGENLTYGQLFALISEALGRRPPRFTLPAGPLRRLGSAADLLGIRLGLPMPLSEGLMVAACARLFYSSDKARRELGYRFRPAAEAIADAVGWYRQRNII